MVGGYVISGLLFDSHTRHRGCPIAGENVQFGPNYWRRGSPSVRPNDKHRHTDR